MSRGGGAATLASLFAFVAGLFAPQALAADLSPSLQQGGWSHAVPLELPAAPAGMVPNLSIVADFRTVDGPLGAGFALAGLSRIERRGWAGHGAPDPAGWLDSFVVDGQMLWEEDGYFHTEQDDERYFLAFSPTNQWVVKRDGWTWTYGGFDEGSNGCAVETLRDTALFPCESRGSTPSFDDTTAWLLASVEDPWGNTIKYEYASFAEVDPDPDRFEGHTSYAHQHLPTAISYANGQHRVAFEYNPRADLVSDASSGQARVLAFRLEAIQVQSGLNDTPTSWSAMLDGARYELVYADEDNSACDGAEERASWAAETLAAGTGESLLHRILRVPDGQTGASGGKSLRCATRASEADDWSTAISLGIPDLSLGGGCPGPGCTWSSEREFTEPAFYSHQAVNFDGGPEAELLELRFPICELDWDAHVEGRYLPQIGIQPMVVHSLSGCDTVETEATLWSVDAGEALLRPATSAVLDAALAELATADPADALALVFLDVDRDGRTDAIVAHSMQEAQLFRELPDGSVRQDWLALSTTGEEAAELLSRAVFADIDGDGLVDLATDTDWFVNPGQLPYWNAGVPYSLDLPFSPVEGRHLGAYTAWGDLNGDGVADITVATDGVDNPDCPACATDLIDTVYLGLGDGQFVDSQAELPGPLDGGEFVDWGGTLSGGSPSDPVYFWAPNASWTWADADHDGQAEAFDATLLPHPALAYTDPSGMTPSYDQVLGDWDGDGFLDALYIENAPIYVGLALPSGSSATYTVGTGGAGVVSLYVNARSVAATRLTALTTAWGGEEAYSYGTSADEGRNAQGPGPPT